LLMSPVALPLNTSILLNFESSHLLEKTGILRVFLLFLDPCKPVRYLWLA
jgi:hypothetical protein